jgi:hypothetical protein
MEIKTSLLNEQLYTPNTPLYIYYLFEFINIYI